ncbi:MAG: nucleotide exchange factor GrpE [Lachnospiraceae bacterium]|jgi:molecular chaperone GrpE|nr:nucleotide exchange factor GrpE [Lachnospiraceae bacterium]
MAETEREEQKQEDIITDESQSLQEPQEEENSEDLQPKEQQEEAVEEEPNAEDGEPQGSQEGEAEGETKKRNPFKRKEKKDKAAEQIEELNDKIRRQMAEFDNFRKRTEREKSQMYEIGAKSIVEKILPVVDNFERGLSAVPQEGREDPFVQGMDKIYKQLMTELESAGVVPIEAVGQEFNPDFHNAVMQVESEEYESGVVAQELQKGYMYRESVVRHSMVAVVQ